MKLLASARDVHCHITQPDYDKDREERAKFLLNNKKGHITPHDLFLILRDRYKDTPKYTPPLPFENWRDESEKKGIPRTICTNLCQSSFVAHLRNNIPVKVGAVLWFTMGPPDLSAYFPVYAGSSAIPSSFSTIDAADNHDSVWWIFKDIQKIAATKHELYYPVIADFWTAHSYRITERQKEFEKKFLNSLNSKNKDKTFKLLSAYTNKEAELILQKARRLKGIVQDLSKNKLTPN